MVKTNTPELQGLPPVTTRGASTLDTTAKPPMLDALVPGEPGAPVPDADDGEQSQPPVDNEAGVDTDDESQETKASENEPGNFESVCRQAYADMYHKVRAEMSYDSYAYIWRDCIERLHLVQIDATVDTVPLVSAVPAFDAHHATGSVAQAPSLLQDAETFVENVIDKIEDAI